MKKQNGWCKQLSCERLAIRMANLQAISQVFADSEFGKKGTRRVGSLESLTSKHHLDFPQTLKFID